MSKWDLYEHIYDRLWVQKFSLKPTRDRIIEKLKRLTLPQETLMDMSCGTGQLLDDIKIHLPHLATKGVEPSRLGRVAREKGHEIIETTISELKMKSTFGCICCTHAFPYYESPEQAIQTFSDHLDDNGYLMIAHAETKTFYDRLVLPIVKLTTSSATYPTPRQMRSHLERHFDICDIVQINAWYVPSITLYIARKSRSSRV